MMKTSLFPVEKDLPLALYIRPKNVKLKPRYPGICQMHYFFRAHYVPSNQLWNLLYFAISVRKSTIGSPSLSIGYNQLGKLKIKGNVLLEKIKNALPNLTIP